VSRKVEVLVFLQKKVFLPVVILIVDKNHHLNGGNNYWFSQQKFKKNWFVLLSAITKKVVHEFKIEILKYEFTHSMIPF
jgi:hypothetical protein